MTFEKILKDLEKYCDMTNLSAGNFENKIIHKLPYSCGYEYGATKVCLYFKELDNYVIKIPFSYDYDEWGDEDGCPMENALETGNDYCLSEVYLYKRLKNEYHVEDFFVEIFEIGQINEVPIYAQKMCDVFVDSCHIHYSEKERTSVRNSLYKDKNWRTPYFNTDWLIDSINYYGIELVNMMLEAVTEEDLGDFHEANIGYINKQPVIFDWAGYRE